jgi:putative transposase
MKAQDVTDTPDLALAKSELEQVNVGHRPRLLSDNGASYISGDSAARPIILRRRARSSIGIRR